MSLVDDLPCLATRCPGQLPCCRAALCPCPAASPRSGSLTSDNASGNQARRQRNQHFWVFTFPTSGAVVPGSPHSVTLSFPPLQEVARPIDGHFVTSHRRSRVAKERNCASARLAPYVRATQSSKSAQTLGNFSLGLAAAQRSTHTHHPRIHATTHTTSGAAYGGQVRGRVHQRRHPACPIRRQPVCLC